MNHAELTKTITLPQDVAFAVSTGRPELLKLAVRDMKAEEVALILDALGTLMETNRVLRTNYLRAMSEYVTNQKQILKGQERHLAKLMDRLQNIEEWIENGTEED